jgi:hypothetical protein
MMNNKRNLREKKEIDNFKSAQFRMQYNCSKQITFALNVIAVITFYVDPAGRAV